MADDDLPWVEKYRPKTLGDVISHEKIVVPLKKMIKNKRSDFPHLLFYGPPGTGKTTTVRALARDLWGPRLFKQRVLELNASDERGISVIRTRVKNFASMTATKRDKRYPSPQFKLIILDEADNMTAPAQAALRRTIENFAGVTRVCLICNYLSKIISPLASRCLKFQFAPLPPLQNIQRLEYIAKEESIDGIDDKIIKEIVSHSKGDMRRAITLLQSCFKLFGKSFTLSDISEITGDISSDEIDAHFSFVRSCPSSHDISQFVENLQRQGKSCILVCEGVTNKLLQDDSIPSVPKAFIVQKLAKMDLCLSEGGSEKLQALDFLMFFVAKLKEHSS
ncbi:Replication factor C subunit 2 [Aduncisulcus paluster]|uniref:Replication factor C subunit 2 n=1 Tax=Aduncisulcus paluster TaxID=2918883 RepID=A0ABQ5K5Z9_9EUKA|nr:Replication factor C subunit 2 [Aduncisulcus paluster]|eukprot:gnl/Carplike_NY0171/8839_a12288_187.p1 GENE.gnl/Carplike_NY0171/8839_a12288_187~~gnl/Carplike_NY0171/8839_a12288_187.p1  ORF type:complete len:336 (-),score=65.54 gnl/Carplike_NY0171/8839_a12288_187:30-1037(-)